MEFKGFTGLLLLAVFGVVLTILGLNKFIIVLRRGYITDPANRNKAIRGLAFYLSLLLYILFILAMVGIAFGATVRILENPPAL